MKDTNQVETISISDGDKVYEFEKPDFECELLKVVGDMIIGWATFTDNSGITAMVWYLEGNKFGFKYGEERRYNRSLTPIKQKKEWYEDEANFPALITPTNGNGIIQRAKGYKHNNGKHWFTLDCTYHVASFSAWRVLTKAERDSFFFCLDIDATSSKETN